MERRRNSGDKVISLVQLEPDFALVLPNMNPKRCPDSDKRSKRTSDS